MREYIYLWVNKFVWSGKDNEGNNRYLFENVGIPLSSKYDVTRCEFNEKSSEFIINCENRNIKVNYFSEHINDLVAMVGDNGSGKSSLLELLKLILTKEAIKGDEKYVLIYADDNEIKVKSTLANEITFKIKDENSFIELNVNNDDHESDHVIYYAPFFNVAKNNFGTQGGNYGLADISTEKVIDVYANKLHNVGMGNRFDRLVSYSYYEQLVEMVFVADFLEHENKLPMDLPKYMYVNSNDGSIEMLEKQLNDRIKLLTEDIKKNTMRNDELIKLEKEKGTFTSLEQEKSEILDNIKNCKLERANKKMLLKSIGVWKNDASLKDRVLLSVFSSLYRNYGIDSNTSNRIAISTNMDIVNAFNVLKKHITKEINIKKIECLCELITNNSIPTDDGRRLFYIKKNKSMLNIIMNRHYDIIKEYGLITPFLIFERQRLSTGESNFMQFFARFYHIWKDSPIQIDSIRGAKNIVFLIDEGEANFHPEWQRKYIKTLIEWIEIVMDTLKKKGFILGDIPKFQILLSTHSPFVACDLPNKNMVRLKLKNEESTNDFKSVQPQKSTNKDDDTGIGASIIKLLKGDFFLSSTVGALTEEKITKMIDEIQKNKSSGHEKVKLSDGNAFVLENLGDHFLKTLLEGEIQND